MENVKTMFDMIPTWYDNQHWTPFIEDSRGVKCELPVRYRNFPWMAPQYTFDEMCRMTRTPRRRSKTLQRVFDYWSWFAMPITIREMKARIYPPSNAT